MSMNWRTPLQDALVQHDAHLRRARVGADQDLLAFQPDLHPPLDFLTGIGRVPHADDRAGVIGGLQQAGDEFRFIGPDRRGLGL